MRVPMFGLGIQGKSPNVTAQSRTNIYYEISQQEDKTKVTAYGTPGLILYADFGETPARGLHSLGDYYYVVHRGTFWKVDNAGTKTSLGTLDTTTGTVSISDNGTQIMIVDGTSGYIYNTSTLAFAKIVDADFPAGASTVTFIAGYFVISIANSGRFYISGLYDGTTWDALDYANAESNPDFTTRVFSDHGQLLVFGKYSTEFWQNSGATDFPLSALTGATIEFGAVSPWSVCKFENAVVYLARNRLGECKVLMLTNYTPVEISDQSLDHILNSYSAVEDAVAYSYMMDGHSFYVISFPTAGETWMFDNTTGAWTQLKSKDISRHRSSLQINYLNKSIVSDYENGKLYLLDSDTYTDNGEMIEREIIGRHVFSDMDTLFVSEFQLDMETGIGTASGQGSDPQVMLQVSKDNGHTWGNELWRSAGAIGKYLTRVIWRRLGRGRDFVFKVRITDPVKVVITGAYMDFDKGR